MGFRPPTSPSLTSGTPAYRPASAQQQVLDEEPEQVPDEQPVQDGKPPSAQVVPEELQKQLLPIQVLQQELLPQEHDAWQRLSASRSQQ